MERLMVFSADDHAGAAPETYREFLEAQYFEAYDGWVKERTAVRAAANRPAGPTRKSEQPGADAAGAAIRSEMMVEERRRFGSDLEFRLKQLESDGIVGEVLFPDANVTGLGIPFASSFGGALEGYGPEYLAAGYRAHSRWQAAGIDPTRQIGLAFVAYHDIDAAVREIHWARSAGLGGVALDGINPDFPPLHDQWYDPMWSACEEEGLPVHFHAGTGNLAARRATGTPSGGADSMDTFAGGVDGLIRIMELPLFDRRPLWYMINGGVFDRHPRLKIVFAEQGALWASRSMAQNDWMWENLGFGADRTPRRPSEYLEHVFFGASNPFARWEIQARHDIGVDQVMWGSDHPHFGSPWGVTTEWLRVSFGAEKVPENELRAMLGGNAARLYGLDVKELNQIADACGPKLSEVMREELSSDHDHAAIKVMESRPARTGG